MPNYEFTADKILAWADGFYARRGRYPRENDGLIDASGLTWSAVSQALRRGRHGLPGGSTLAKLLRDRRGRRHKRYPPRLTPAQILRWADAHHERTGDWPGHDDGPIPASGGETWPAVEDALRVGSRGLPGGSSVAQLLEARRGVRNRMALPPLSVEQILAWADRHHKRTGSWPSVGSGPVPGQRGETWNAVGAALQMGHRGLPSGTTLARLLAEHRGVRHSHDVPRLSVEQILAWADAHKARTGRWPPARGPILDAEGETWDAVSGALAAALRGLPGGDTLPQLLARHRGKRNPSDLPPLTREQIEGWMRAHHRRCGTWPRQDSGPIPDAPPGETWATVHRAMERGRRGLPRGLTLVRLRDGMG